MMVLLIEASHPNACTPQGTAPYVVYTYRRNAFVQGKDCSADLTDLTELTEFRVLKKTPDESQRMKWHWMKS